MLRLNRRWILQIRCTNQLESNFYIPTAQYPRRIQELIYALISKQPRSHDNNRNTIGLREVAIALKINSRTTYKARLFKNQSAGIQKQLTIIWVLKNHK